MTSSDTPPDTDAAAIGRQLAALLVAGLAAGEPIGGAMIGEAQRLSRQDDPRTAAGFYEHIARCLRAACRIVDVDAYLTLIDDAGRDQEGSDAAQTGRGLATGVVRVLAARERIDGGLHRVAHSMLSHDSDAVRDAFFAQLERLLWVAARFAGANGIDPISVDDLAAGAPVAGNPVAGTPVAASRPNGDTAAAPPATRPPTDRYH